ncbi:MFS transporter-like protein [Polyplosphaeria fusca]|uniref:MFS transporter-like protein n=1 Tax=Polyplosphaeria fusca TaxID=682080 RepID=A0A9P4V0S1_9PLEO|nr:MFS transporter-like protein [Polyplosphaeria fusca]
MTSRATPRASLDNIEEGAPLLSPDSEAFPLPIPDAAPKKHKPWLLLCVLIFFLVAIVDIGAFLAEAPKTRVYETNLCVRYYREHDPSKIVNGHVDEELCKEDVIQERLASLFGWQELFDSIPGILLAVPLGTLADRVGRKWVFASCLMGLQLNSAWILLICYFESLPLQLTWLSSAFYICGGGPIVATAVGITMVSDICPPEKRTAIFLYLTASVLVAELIAPILAARLMESGNWFPLLLALAIQQVGICIAIFFPETLHLRDLPEPVDPPLSPSIELQTKPKTSIRKLFGFRAQVGHFRDAYLFLRRDYQLALVIFTFFANRIGRQALTLLIRYASKRYHWKISQAAYLLSFRAATNLVALTVFVPLVNLILLRVVRLPSHHADIWIARGSIVLTTLAFFCMGTAAQPALLIIGLLVFNLGTGYNAAMRSISIHVVGGQSSPDTGRLFAVVAIIESIGTMIAGPTLSSTFQWGIERGEPWIGAPFFFATLIFGVMMLVTFAISFKSPVIIQYEDESGDESERLASPRASSSALRRSISPE